MPPLTGISCGNPIILFFGNVFTIHLQALTLRYITLHECMRVAELVHESFRPNESKSLNSNLLTLCRLARV